MLVHGYRARIIFFFHSLAYRPRFALLAFHLSANRIVFADVSRCYFNFAAADRTKENQLQTEKKLYLKKINAEKE